MAKEIYDIDNTPKNTEDFNYLIYCSCGCGGALWKYDSKGEPHYYLKDHEKHLGITNRKAPRNKRIKRKGYVLILIKRGEQYLYKREHRQVMENILGRKLKRSEYVHHVNQNKEENSPKNLFLCNDKEHRAIHVRIKTLKDVYGQSLSSEMYRFCLNRLDFIKFQIRMSEGISRI